MLGNAGSDGVAKLAAPFFMDGTLEFPAAGKYNRRTGTAQNGGRKGGAG